MQRINLKDEDWFDRDLWRKKNYVFGLRKIVYSQKIHMCIHHTLSCNSALYTHKHKLTFIHIA
jgi:hypothetical protein